MKTVLIYTSPAHGHLYPMMDVAIELKNQGYKVIIQTLSSDQKNVTSEGIQHLAISKEIESLPLEDYKENNPISQLKSTFKCWLERAPLEFSDLKKSYSKFNPDLLIVDVNTWGAGAFAESLGKPWVMFMPYCLPISSDDTPAFGPGFSPPTNLLHRLRDRLVDGFIQNSLKSIIEDLNHFRVNAGCSSFNKYTDLFSKPDLLLYRTAEPFDYSRKEWPKNILHIGPGLWAPPGNIPEWLNDLQTPKVLVSISTEMQDDVVIIKTAIEAFANAPISLIITSAANDPNIFELPPDTDNIKITKFLSHSEVIPEVDLVITHGGMGTTQRALAAGKPVCIIPCGRDQKETARRVEVSDSGIYLPKPKLNKVSLQEAVHNALNKKPGAEKIARSFKKTGGANSAVHAIKKLL